jgi:hypothetical protein
MRPSGRKTVQPPFHNALHALHIKATSGRCCPSVRTVATLMHAIFIIRTASGLCCPDVRMVAILLHVLPYQGPRPDGVALSSERMQLYSHIHVCKGNSITCWTLMSVRTCCHDVRTDATLNCLNFLDTDGHPNAWPSCLDGILGSDFSKLEFAQNLLWASWNTFMKWRLWNKWHPW